MSKRKNKKSKKRKGTSIQEPLTVSNALKELRSLNRSRESSSLSTTITPSLTEDDRDQERNALPPSSENISDSTATGFNLKSTSETGEETDETKTSCAIKTDTIIKNEIAGIKSKCQNTSITISLGISGIIATILIAVLLYLNGTTAGELSKIESKLTTFISTITQRITSLEANKSANITTTQKSTNKGQAKK